MLPLLKTKQTKSNFDDLMRTAVKVKPEKKRPSAKR
jgi:hypothetical protein